MMERENIDFFLFFYIDMEKTMRQLAFNEIEMVNGARLIDSYTSSAVFWGTFGAGIGGTLLPLFSYMQPVVEASPWVNTVLTTVGGDALLALNILSGIGIGFAVGAAFGVGLYYLVHQI